MMMTITRILLFYCDNCYNNSIIYNLFTIFKTKGIGDVNQSVDLID